MLLGICVAQFISIGAEFGNEYPMDYLWAGIKRMRFFIAAIIGAELLIGLFVLLPFLQFLFSRYLPENIVCKLAFSVFAGIVVVSLPRGVEMLLIDLLAVNKLDRWAFKGLVWLGATTHLQLGENVQVILEQDNIDWHQQQPGFWYSGRSPEETGRITRIAYEAHKAGIALQRNNPKFLEYDVEIYPGYKFYLLAKYLGRKTLREMLHNPPKLGEWSGQERRRQRDPGSAGLERRRGRPEGRILRFPRTALHEAEARIRSLAGMKDDWDGYGAPAPNGTAFVHLHRILDLMEPSDFHSATILPSAEGGLGICFVHGNRYADIECLNDGEIIGVRYVGKEIPRLIDISGTRSSIRAALKQIREHLYGWSSSNIETKRAAGRP